MNELDELRAKTFTPEKMTELDWFIWNNRNLRGEQAYAELTALRARVAAQDKAIDFFEFDETTGECLMGCGGCASDGHNIDCEYISKLVELGLMTTEPSAKI